MRIVRQRLADSCLVIAGEGSERQNIEVRIKELGLSDAVHLLGATPGAGPVLAGADLFVNPAYAEAFPYTVIEAMSGGLPIVATDVGGTREALGGGAGVLVAPNDAGALADGILRVLDDPDLATKMGRAGAKAHERFFTTERMVAGILDVYAELVPGFTNADE